ncbi:MAG: hypothetical protein ABIP51_14890 [Bacteroidia bacterium]
MLGTGGTIRGLVLAAFNLKMEVFIAMHKHDLYLIPFLIVVGFVGTYLGKLILRHFSEEQFKSIVLTLILLVGLTTLIKQSMA